MNIFDRGREQAIAVFRIVVGVLFMCHGAQKLFGVLGSKGAVSITDWPSGPAGLIELVGGALIVVGAAHLVGKNGVIQLLKGRGYRVEQQ